MGISQPFQARRRRAGQLGNAFDRIDVPDDFGEHRRLITGAGSDFEYPVAGREAQLLRHVSHDRRLRDRLPACDGQGAIIISGAAQVSGHEFLPRHRLHGP